MSCITLFFLTFFIVFHMGVLLQLVYLIYVLAFSCQLNYSFYYIAMTIKIKTTTATLKLKCRHIDDILIIVCTASCHFQNFHCSQWLKFHQNVNIFVSVNNTTWIHIDINSWLPSHSIWRHRSGSTLAQIVVCCLAAKTLPGPVLSR